jgi:LuxR family maltose regulon positive regulatory protein
MTSSLITTKICVPRLRSDLVSRPHLIERLKAGLQCPLTLISAPAGYGKTTLLAGLANNSDLLVTWLSLDEGDNDPVRFWTHFISALQAKQPHMGNTILQMLRSPEFLDIQSGLIELINEIASNEPSIQPYILVIDDYHLIEEQTIHKDLSFLIEHLPGQLRLVISTRADPPLPLARMRARRQLSEFRAQDLRFTVKETDTLLNSTMGLGLSDEEVAAVDARTEGWIASLQMAAISMQKREDIPAFITAFTGTHRHVLDYLTEEVLNRQTSDTRSFLLETSILDRMTGPLCDAVTGRQDGQKMIERLDNANLFLVSLDDERKWYRYHNLFSSMLSSRLQQLNPKRVAELRTRAAIWFQQNGFMEDAISYALATKDFELSSRLIDAAAPASLVRGELGTLLNWLVKLPETTVRRHPSLCVFNAFALSRVGRMDAAEAWLRRAEDIALPGFLKTLATMTQAILATSHQDDKRTMELLYQVLESDSPADMGTSAEAIYSLIAKLAAAAFLSEAQVTHGQLRGAIDTCHRGLSLVQDKALGAPWSSMVGFLHVRLAWVLYERNELEGATQHAMAGSEIGRQSDNKQVQACSFVALGLIRRAEGDDKAALDLARKVDQIAPRGDLLPHSVSRLPWRLRLWFAQGDITAAAQHIRAYEPALSTGRGGPLQETVGITLGHIKLSEGKLNEAEALLAKVQREAEESGRMGNVIETLLLRALAARALGNVDQAIDLLNTALKLAEPEGYIRIFVDLGMPMATLLKEAVSQGVVSNYVRELLAEFEKKKYHTKAPVYQPLVEPLTERELEVLRLLADGLSNEEISKKLVLKLGTIKTHTHNIYAKFGVRGRAQAIKRATVLNLL